MLGSYTRVFTVTVIVRNSSLLTGVLICLSRKSLLRLRSLLGLCKDKTQREQVSFCITDL